MFRRICIDNYKSFVNFELRLGELTLLVGQNGAGKTGVLDVVYALRKLLEGTARITDRDVFPLSSLTRWQERAVQAFQVEVELDQEAFEYRLEVEHDRRERRARIILETLSRNEGPLFRFARGDVRLYRDDHSEGPHLQERLERFRTRPRGTCRGKRWSHAFSRIHARCAGLWAQLADPRLGVGQ